MILISHCVNHKKGPIAEIRSGGPPGIGGPGIDGPVSL